MNEESNEVVVNKVVRQLQKNDHWLWCHRGSPFELVVTIDWQKMREVIRKAIADG